MLRWILRAAVVLAAAASVTPARGQYIFADTNGDSISSPLDRLQVGGINTVDIWLCTDVNRDGTHPQRPLGSPPLTIFSYDFVLGAVGGTVKWGAYANLQPTMIYPFDRVENGSEIYLGYGGTTSLPPGKYKLGTLTVTVVSGDPSLKFMTRSSIRPVGLTSFGSLYPGKDNDNTIKFTSDRSQLGSTLADVSGDWADADGAAAPSTGTVQGALDAGRAKLKFAVTVTPNPSRPGETHFIVTTTRPGPLSVRLFDVQGRLARTLLAEDNAAAGAHAVELGKDVPGARRLAAGVYWYRVSAIDGRKQGRIVLLR